jgi:hypothetical protein
MRRARILLGLALVAGLPAAGGAADAKGCRDLPILQRLPGCTIRECRTRDYDEAELQSGPVDRTGEYPKEFVDGQTTVVTYVCPATLRLDEIARHAQTVLRRAGYAFVYAGSMFYNDLPGFTARRGGTWVQLVSEPFGRLSGYTVTMVRTDVAGGEIAPGPGHGPSDPR